MSKACFLEYWQAVPSQCQDNRGSVLVLGSSLLALCVVRCALILRPTQLREKSSIVLRRTNEFPNECRVFLCQLIIDRFEERACCRSEAGDINIALSPAPLPTLRWALQAFPSWQDVRRNGHLPSDSPSSSPSGMRIDSKSRC